MIKRIRFATRRRDVCSATFAASWPHTVARAPFAPPHVRPSRVAVCSPLSEYTGPDPKHDGIVIEWFADAEHLERFQEWLATRPGRLMLDRSHRVVDPEASLLIVTDESVLRGPDWLERRWLAGGGALKHMAIAVRAAGLTPADFSERWRSRAGRIQGAGAAQPTVIPDEARGCAYVQNHPRPRSDGEWAYDALNEVYFDDPQSLLRRIRWFRENLVNGAEEDLVSQSWFLAVREEPVPTLE
jgi:hypothetical protein